MKKTTLFYILTLIFISHEYAQIPDIQWQNTIGGTSYDDLYSLQQTTDGGYIIGGLSSSDISGDKTENSQGGYDYWIIKLNSLGSIEWQTTIGGNENDNLSSIKQTTDGGFIVGGYSISNISGDKSENNKAGTFDYWVVKLNSTGTIMWQNTIGGNGHDQLTCLNQTLDGGYILAGYSNSGISGDKSEANLGGYDYWVIKISPIGNIQWQNTIGGSGEDILFSVEQTIDGGYIIGGWGGSGISGDKTEPCLGSSDFWVLKLTPAGNITWQNTISGNATDRLYSVNQTFDGGYILGGYSDSGISGDKTEANIGGYDYWVVKLNSSGTILWQNTIGGTNPEDLITAQQTSDGGYILGGYSSSGIGGDKTAPNLFGEDFWILKLNSTGEIIWQQTYGGNGTDRFYCLQETSDQGFLLGGWSDTDIDGNKTEASIGLSDYWIIKLEGTCIPLAETCNGIDDNCNGVIDESVSESININASGPTTFCQGSSVVLSAIYTGTTVQWKKDGINIIGATNSTYTATQKATYTCETASDCGTALSTGIYVNVQKNPTAIITAGGSTTFCTGGSVTLTANAGVGLSYQWYKGMSVILGATNVNYVASTTGNYKCQVTKMATGCSKISNGIVVTVTCKEGENNYELSIYPNPSNNVFTISSNKIIEFGIITVTDIHGKSIFTNLIEQTDFIEINLGDYSKGIYFMQLEENGKQYFYKLIKV